MFVGDGLVRQIDGQRIARPQASSFSVLWEFLHLLLRQCGRKSPVFEAIIVQNARIAGRDANTKALVVDAPGARSRLEPQPKFARARSTDAPSYSGKFRTNSGSAFRLAREDSEFELELRKRTKGYNPPGLPILHHDSRKSRKQGQELVAMFVVVTPIAPTKIAAPPIPPPNRNLALATTSSPPARSAGCAPASPASDRKAGRETAGSLKRKSRSKIAFAPIRRFHRALRRPHEDSAFAIHKSPRATLRRWGPNGISEQLNLKRLRAELPFPQVCRRWLNWQVVSPSVKVDRIRRRSPSIEVGFASPENSSSTRTLHVGILTQFTRRLAGLKNKLLLTNGHAGNI